MDERKEAWLKELDVGRHCACMTREECIASQAAKLIRAYEDMVNHLDWCQECAETKRGICTNGGGELSDTLASAWKEALNAD